MAADVLLDSVWAARHLSDPGVVFLDVRAASDYWSGHLRGARHFDVSQFAHGDAGGIDPENLEARYSAIFSLLGLGGGEHVVVYEKRSDVRAARAAWLLEYLGHASVSILDGGLQAWPDAVLEQDARPYAPHHFMPAIQPQLIALASDILQHLNEPDHRLLDSRRAREYYGEEKRTSRAGAIPGAMHLDYVEHIAPNGCFKPVAELKSAFDSLGLDPKDDVVTYCGGGSRAALAFYALRLAGYAHARTYLGSWREWASQPELPVAHPVRKPSL